MQRRRRCGKTHMAQNSQGFRRERHVQASSPVARTTRTVKKKGGPRQTNRNDQSPHHPLATGGWVGVGPLCRGVSPDSRGGV
jgi:hypothetical protein